MVWEYDVINLKVAMILQELKRHNSWDLWN